MSGLIEKLERNARFYERESAELLEKEDRRDVRRLGGREARLIAELLREAVTALQQQPPSPASEPPGSEPSAES